MKRLWDISAKTTCFVGSDLTSNWCKNNSKVETRGCASVFHADRTSPSLKFMTESLECVTTCTDWPLKKTFQIMVAQGSDITQGEPCIDQRTQCVAVDDASLRTKNQIDNDPNNYSNISETWSSNTLKPHQEALIRSNPVSPLESIWLAKRNCLHFAAHAKHTAFRAVRKYNQLRDGCDGTLYALIALSKPR